MFSNRKAEERWEQKVEKRSAPLRSGSMFFGDLTAVNLKVDHFLFVSPFQLAHDTDKRGSNTVSRLIGKLWAV